MSGVAGTCHFIKNRQLILSYITSFNLLGGKYKIDLNTLNPNFFESTIIIKK